ncbi:MAG: YraN family protein, partial [Smithellaceae bacterium]|nr:YraN family protein [Smithellaceae bacterium]
QRGKEGEDLAVKYLQAAGYRIVKRNFRCRLGEIDIIARDGETLVFVEVKMRTNESHGDPEAAVDRAKQKKISLVSLHYLQTNKIPDQTARYDVVAVQRTGVGHEIRLIKDAFDLSP